MVKLLALGGVDSVHLQEAHAIVVDGELLVGSGGDFKVLDKALQRVRRRCPGSRRNRGGQVPVKVALQQQAVTSVGLAPRIAR